MIGEIDSNVGEGESKNYPVSDDKMARGCETLEKSQQEEEDEEQDNFNETVKQNESKKAVAEAEAQNKIDDIHADSDDPAEKTSFTNLESRTLQSDLLIGRERKEIKICEDSLKKTAEIKRNLDDIIANNDPIENGVEYHEVKMAVNEDLVEKGVEYFDVKTAVEMTIYDVKFVEKAVRGDNDEHELYSTHLI